MFRGNKNIDTKELEISQLFFFFFMLQLESLLSDDKTRLSCILVSFCHVYEQIVF